MILIWMLMAVGLLVMVLGGFVSRARIRQRRADEIKESATHPRPDSHHSHPHGGHGHGGDATPARRHKGHH